MMLLWIVEAIGPSNLLISVPFFSSHVFLASGGCELADTIYILGHRCLWCVLSAHWFVTLSVSFCSVVAPGGKVGVGVVVYVVPVAISCIITVHATFVTYRCIQ